MAVDVADVDVMNLIIITRLFFPTRWGKFYLWSTVIIFHVGVDHKDIEGD